MESGHVGPVRFLTCVEIPKTNNQLENDDLYRTIVISGGEGKEEYKSSIGMNAPNQNSTQNQIFNSLEGQSSTNSNTNIMASNYVSGSPVSTLTHALSNSYMGSSTEETNTGKDDLVNYLLTWEIT